MYTYKIEAELIITETTKELREITITSYKELTSDELTTLIYRDEVDESKYIRTINSHYDIDIEHIYSIIQIDEKGNSKEIK